MVRYSYHTGELSDSFSSASVLPLLINDVHRGQTRPPSFFRVEQ